jgi:dTMP kinase
MFITLEGSEGAGKSTLIKHLKKYFLDRNIEFIFTKEPGASEVGAKLRKLLLDKSVELDPLSETFLLLADRIEHVRKIINPALEVNKNVLSDRYLDSTYAYQGAGRKINKDELDKLIKPLKFPVPDLTIYLDLPVKEGLKRAKGRDRLDRFEEEELDFFERIRNSYLKLAQEDSNRIVTIDSTNSEKEIFETAKEYIEKKLNEN